MRYLGIDIGSSYVKGAVLDTEEPGLSHVERTQAPQPVGGLDPLFREIDPEDSLRRMEEILERLHAHAPDAAGVLVCSQLHSLILVDAKGRPTTRCITWQDRRALSPMPGTHGTWFDQMERLLTEAERQELGNERVPGLPLNCLYWLSRNCAPAGLSGTPVALPYYLAARLCGTKAVSDITHATGHGALNVNTGDWHHGVIQKMGLSELSWPSIAPQGTVLGQWRHAGRALDFYAPVGDYHCSQVGSLLEPGELAVNISTGSAVIQIAEDPGTGLFQRRPWFDSRHLKTITHIPGGRALHALVKLLSELATRQSLPLGDPWEYIHREAAHSTGGGLVIDPAFYACNTGNSGSILNLCEDNMTIGHLFHALFEGMAANYDACSSRINPRRSWSRVVFSGGVAMKNRVLRQLISARLGATHRLSPVKEDTLFGLLALGLAFTGRTRSVAEAIVSLRSIL